MKERLRRTIEIVLPLTGVIFLSTTAFTKRNRREVGYRDKWECQGLEDECQLGRGGKPARFQDGFMVQAAHYEHDKSNLEYDNPESGRILCVPHHALEHLQKGEEREAQAILNMGIYTHDATKKGIEGPQIKLRHAQLQEYIDAVHERPL